MSYTITIRGDEEALRKLVAIEPERVAAEPLRKAAMALVGALARYPSPPSGSTYVRTGTLGRAWVSIGASLHYVVGNNVRYATYVQGPEQAWMHRGRWRTADEVAQGSVEQIARDIAEGVARVLGG